jgi:hypothetical protein
MSRSLALAVAFVAAVALAGKPERDKQKEVTPELAKDTQEIKAACGCDVKITPKWESFPKADDMGRIKTVAEYFTTAAKDHCQSPEDKKALCDNVKELHIVFDNNVPEPLFANKVITCHSNNSSANSDGQFKAILDKF